MIRDMRSLPRLFAGLAVSLALVAPAFALEMFPDEAKAQQHCPKDEGGCVFDATQCCVEPAERRAMDGLTG
jgi:hypothetical protein